MSHKAPSQRSAKQPAYFGPVTWRGLVEWLNADGVIDGTPEANSATRPT